LMRVSGLWDGLGAKQKALEVVVAAAVRVGKRLDSLIGKGDRDIQTSRPDDRTRSTQTRKTRSAQSSRINITVIGPDEAREARGIK